MPIVVIPAAVAERAATRCVRNESGCLISVYSLNKQGYAQIGWWEDGRSRMVGAHRAAWVHHTGEQIPEAMTLDHTCKTRPCVDFDHLRMLTNFENARRTFGRDWPLGECANGHPNSELRHYASGLGCGICRAETSRRYRERVAT